MIGRVHALRVVHESLRSDAGGPAGAARRRATRDWQAVVRLANAHYLGPAMHANLARLDALAELPEDVGAYLELLHRLNRDRNAALRAQADELIAGMNRAGLAPVLLKGGIALYGDLYPDPGMRMIRDLDVLVPAAAAKPAIAALAGLGYRVETLYPEGHHAYGDFVRPGAPGAVDLHFDLVDCAHVVGAAELAGRAVAMRRDGLQFLVPSPTDCVLHHLVHAQIHHLGKYYRGVLELRQLYEFVALIRRFGAEVDRDAIAGRLARYRLGTVLEAYALSAHRLLGLDWPAPDGPPTGRWSAAARLQHARCMMQLVFPVLETVVLPAANLRAAFAWHRMEGLYGPPRRWLGRRLAHAARYLHKSTAGGAVRRLFKTR